MAIHAGELQNLLDRLTAVETDTLREMREAEGRALRDARFENMAQVTRALHREVSEAVRELTDAVRAAQAVARVRG
jgi:hypothetical protein